MKIILTRHIFCRGVSYTYIILYKHTSYQKYSVIFFLSGGGDIEDSSSSHPEPQKKKQKLSIPWQKSERIRLFNDPTDIVPLADTNPNLIDLSPVDIFRLYFSDDLLNLIVENTILYARQKNDHKFTFDKESLMQFIGVLITSSFNT